MTTTIIIKKGNIMKKHIKALSVFLAFLLTLSVFVSCDSDNTPGNDTLDAGSESASETTSETIVLEDKPDISKKNYGADYFLHIHGDVNPIDFYWVEESENDVLSQAIYDRQRKVSDYLGVEIIGTRTLTETNYIEPFKTAVKNKDGSVHTLLTHNYQGIPSLVSQNFFTDLKTVSQLDLDADYWNADFMDSISVKDHYFLGFSNFNILYTNVISFNKAMMAKYEASLDESVYSMVNNYRWTLDQMISLANLVYIDTTGDGKTIDDTFGISGLQSVPFVNFLQGSNINLVELNEKGDYEVSVYNELNKNRTTVLVDKLLELAKSDCSWFWADRAIETVKMNSGKVLMNLSPSIELPSYLNYDVDFGVLPYPMFDESQKDVGYRSLQWGGYIALPSYLDDPDMAAETIEMLSYFSDDVNTAFYEKLLGKQVADSPDDKKMLEIIWDSVCSDFGQTYFEAMPGTNLLYIVPILTVANTTKNIASFMATVDKSANKLIRKFLSGIQ